jgi:nucleoside-diphosphate-sugar epimerase
MVICVVGGCGFIGRRVVRQLAGQGHAVVVLDIQTADHFDKLKPAVHVVRADITQFEDLVAAFTQYRPDVIINLTYMIGDYPPRAAFKVNVLGLDNCFEAARICGVSHVVYTSSNAVYGSGQAPYGERPVHETDRTMPRKQYAVHKTFNEWQAREYREKHGMRVTGIRVANVAGLDKILGSLDHVQCAVLPALGEKAVFPYRDKMRCVIYVDDVADVIARVATKREPAHDLYNSGGETLSLGDIAEIVRRFIPEAEIEFENETGGRESAEAYILDNSRLVQEFGISYLPYERRIAQMIDSVRRGSTVVT